MYTLSLQAMEASGKMTFLIDGFPRNKDNLDGWNTAMSEVAEVKKVLFFSCSEQVRPEFFLFFVLQTLPTQFFGN